MENRRSYLLCALALSMPLLAVHALETRLLFVSDREGSRDIWVMDREGQNPEPLTKGNYSAGPVRTGMKGLPTRAS